MTLRQQLSEVACRRLGALAYGAIKFPLAVDALCLRAFKENWPRDSRDTRIVLHCASLLDTVGAVTEAEPGIPDEPEF